ncbi:MAG: S26 family signal peptidase, partial [Christensenellaceae bacterium]
VVTIGEGEIWCMGDNRGVSLDSTEVGAFETKDLYGIVPKWAEKSKDFLSGVYKVILFIRGENI